MKLGNSETDELQGTASFTSRGRSSLDYQVRSRTEKPILTPKPGKRKNQRQQLQDEQQQYYRRTHQTRARGSSGPPKRKWDLSDLGNMNEEQLLEALYADPELAQEAAKLAEKLAEEEATPPTSAPTGARNARRPTAGGKKKSKPAKKEFSEYPDHMRDLMDGGIPFMQWMIIVAVLGFAAYWVRKIIVLPEKKEQTRIVANRSRGKGAKHRKIEKKPKNAPTADTNGALSLEEAVRAIERDDEAEAAKKPGASASKKTATKKKKKGKANATAISRKKDERQQPSLAGRNKDVKPSTVTESILSVPNTAENEDDGVGWQTVSKYRSAPGEEKHSSTPPGSDPAHATTPKSDAPFETMASTGTTHVAEKPELKPQATIINTNATRDASVTTAKETEDLKGTKKQDQLIDDRADSKENNPAPSNGLHSSKKKKKKGATASDKAAPKNPATEARKHAPTAKSPEDNIKEPSSPQSSTENDEALAQKLQREEETLANAEMSVGEEDVWEEVTTRKRKGH